ncbi:unnamed protein product [Pieris macdunnoughi]|uniref:Uncharacterized protein n=1 Tax=Pieris macdunnoughi TaxID=345717 RepID=A0A821R554_9NEOP|nr:unnamed protein product [Pieris macdunnoughi]
MTEAGRTWYLRLTAPSAWRGRGAPDHFAAPEQPERLTVVRKPVRHYRAVSCNNPVRPTAAAHRIAASR